MKIKFVLAALCACFLALSAAAQDGATPDFKDYAAPAYRGRAATLKLTTPLARNYRTRLREGARRALNFAGQYKLHTWSCGTGCLQMALIDAKTGSVFFPEELNGFIGCYYGSEPVNDLEEALQFQKGSRLIVMAGYPYSERGKDEPKKGLYYYEWTGAELKLLKFVRKSEDC